MAVDATSGICLPAGPIPPPTPRPIGLPCQRWETIRGRVMPEVINRDGSTRNEGQTLGLRFEMALLYACRLHAQQRRKGGDIPYIGHLLGVASIVIEAGGNEDQAIAALLHDAVEDQGGEETRRAIEDLFGADVARIVSASSDEAPGTSKRSKENWHVRKVGYLNTIPGKPEDALLVSLADKIYNARSILADLSGHGEALWPRFNQGKEQQLWY